VQATVIQQALGGHAIPVDSSSRRALARLGIAEAATDSLALRSMLERAIPKNRGAEFVDLLEELAHDTCIEPEPDCPRCDLRKHCPTAHARKEAAQNAARQAAAKAKSASKQLAKAAKVAPRPSRPRPAVKKAAKPAKGQTRRSK
jgi:endonuclease-3